MSRDNANHETALTRPGRACHSPRNALGASGEVHDLSGGLMPVINWYAPDLTRDAETGMASTPLSGIVQLLRSGEEEYRSLGLADPTLNDDALIAAMVAHPRLIERPILVVGERAVIGRPPEAILEILP